MGKLRTIVGSDGRRYDLSALTGCWNGTEGHLEALGAHVGSKGGGEGEILQPTWRVGLSYSDH